MDNTTKSRLDIDMFNIKDETNWDTDVGAESGENGQFLTDKALRKDEEIIDIERTTENE